MAKFANILETVGNTPVVRIGRLAPPDVQLYVKVEAFNPLGSVKDRLALGVIEDAERSGKLKPGGTIIEGTSGNTGMGLAIAAVVKGYKCIFTTTDKQSKEKVDALKAFGAEIVFTGVGKSAAEIEKEIAGLRKKMLAAAQNMEFEQAAEVRDRINGYLEQSGLAAQSPRVVPLTGDASDRRYFRILLPDGPSSGPQTRQGWTKRPVRRVMAARAGRRWTFTRRSRSPACMSSGPTVSTTGLPGLPRQVNSTLRLKRSPIGTTCESVSCSSE